MRSSSVALHRGLFLVALAGAGLETAAAAAEFPKFEHRVIDPMCGQVCYAVTLADVDGDGRQDIVAVTENRVLWYRQPDHKAGETEWKKGVILEDQTKRDNVCIAPLDVDGDGKVDFALGAGWTKIGTIQWITRGKSPDDKWTVHLIGEEPWLHRMRFADVLGTGRPQLVISPLNKTVGDGVRLSAFEIPKNPKTDRWPMTVLDPSLNRMHNHWHVDLDGDDRIDTLTASQEGVHLVAKGAAGWTKTKLGNGAAGAKPEETGAGEIRIGRLGSATRYIATVEPMHGHSVVAYLPPKDPNGGLWSRVVLDDTLRRGHAVGTADLDGDGVDEIIIGHSDPGLGTVKGPGVYVYRADDATGTKWTKHVIDDGGVATEDLVAADLTGDGRIDIVAGGRATHNVKLYVNAPPAK